MPRAAAAVAEAVMGGGAAGLAATTLPADRLLLSIDVIPKPDVELLLVIWAGTPVRRRGLDAGETGVGDGGCCGGGCSGWWRSVLSCMCEYDEFLGLPRKKDPNIVVRVGGDSVPALIWASMADNSARRRRR